MLAVAVTVAYLLVLLAIGVFKSRQVRGQEAFSLADRKLGLFVLVGTLVATWTGTGSIFGNAQKAYQDGLPVLSLVTGPVFGLLVMLLLCVRVRAAGRYTLQDLLEERFGLQARVFATLTLIGAYLVIVSYQFRAAAIVVNRLSEHAGLSTIDPGLLVATVALVIALYTTLAGMKGVAITDTFNGLLMLAGLLIALPLVWSRAGGSAGVLAALPESGRHVGGAYSGFYYASYLLPTFLLVMGDANLHGRFLSARSDAAARWSVLLMIPCIILLDSLIVLIAVAGRAVLPALDHPAQVVLDLGLTALPAGIGALLAAAILAIILSTADSYLLTASSSLVRDVYQRFLRRDAGERELLAVARAGVLLLAALALGMSFLSDDFFHVAFFAYTIYGVGITPVLLAALFWKGATRAGALASMAAGTLVAVGWETGGWGPRAALALGQPPDTPVDAVIPALLAATLALVAVSISKPGLFSSSSRTR